MLRRCVLVQSLVVSLVVGGCAPTKRQISCLIGDVETEREDPEGRIVWRGAADGGSCTGIYSMHADGTGIRRLTARPSELFYTPQVPRLSPDGHLISFVGQCGDEEKPQPDLCVMNSDGTEARTVATSGELKIDMRFAATWSPEGTRLAFTRSRPTSSTSADTSVHVIGLDGAGETRLLNHAQDPAWSPEGGRIAIVSDRDGTDKIYVVKSDGSDLIRLTDGPKDEHPAWSPDSTRIAFESERAGKPILRNTSDQDPQLVLPVGMGGRDIYVMQADGSAVMRLTEDPSYNVDPAWSPDGRRIAFASNRAGEFQIHVMNADGSGVRQLTRTRDNAAPSWAPWQAA